MKTERTTTGWPLGQSQATSLWGSAELGLLMEAMPDDPVRIEFERWSRKNEKPMLALWGMPDFTAFREMCGLTVEQASAAYGGITPDEIRYVEMAWTLPTSMTALIISRRLGMPLGAFYHDAYGAWHPLTRLFQTFAERINARIAETEEHDG